MHLSTLSETGLGISRDEIQNLFAPFVERSFAPDEADWNDEIRRRERKILRKYLKRVCFGWLPATQRSHEVIIEEYTKAWRPSEYDMYSLDQTPPRISPWVWGDLCMFASDVGATRFRQLLLIRLIEQIRPRSVLEVGCGNGVNLLLLAGMFPEVAFTGVELTEQGHRAAVGFQQLDVLPEAMQGYAPLPVKDPTAFKKIRFLQGTAASLPFGDGEIDLVMTILALEQMERIRPQALAEIARVAGRHTLMIEPFRDVNKAGWPRRNIIRRNYFTGRIGDLSSYGLTPILATNDFPQEAFLKACAVLSEKGTGPAT